MRHLLVVTNAQRCPPTRGNSTAALADASARDFATLLRPIRRLLGLLSPHTGSLSPSRHLLHNKPAFTPYLPFVQPAPWRATYSTACKSRCCGISCSRSSRSRSSSRAASGPTVPRPEFTARAICDLVDVRRQPGNLPELLDPQAARRNHAQPADGTANGALPGATEAAGDGGTRAPRSARRRRRGAREEAADHGPRSRRPARHNAGHTIDAALGGVRNLQASIMLISLYHNPSRSCDSGSP